MSLLQALPAQNPLVQVHGYSDETIFKDSRFKVSMALKERGLLDTEAGARAFMQAKPRTNPRLDSFTSVENQFHLSNRKK